MISNVTLLVASSASRRDPGPAVGAAAILVKRNKGRGR